MNVTSKSLSNRQREELTTKLFSDLLQFGKHLQKEGVIHIDYLIKLEELCEFEKNQQLTHDIIHSSTSRISTCMSKAFPQLENQLASYWNAWATIFQNKPSEFINIREKTDQYLSHMMEIDSMYKEIINQNPETNNVVLYAVFFVHVLKTEKIEYPLKLDLESYLNSTNQYDIDEIFSTGEKMPNTKSKTKFVTHGRALRDAIAHKKFTIQNKGNKKQIIFENIDIKFGYSFKETFTVDEFLHYIKSNDMLYRMMFMMQSQIILSTLLHESVDLLKN